jgi:hypothetical protein
MPAIITRNHRFVESLAIASRERTGYIAPQPVQICVSKRATREARVLNGLGLEGPHLLRIQRLDTSGGILVTDAVLGSRTHKS